VVVSVKVQCGGILHTMPFRTRAADWWRRTDTRVGLNGRHGQALWGDAADWLRTAAKHHLNVLHKDQSVRFLSVHKKFHSIGGKTNQGSCDDIGCVFFNSFRKGPVVCRGLDLDLSGKVAKKTPLTRKRGRHAHNVFLRPYWSLPNALVYILRGAIHES